MKIALIGYGKMGKTIEQLAIQKGHQISHIIDTNTTLNITKEDTDVAIEFTEPAAAIHNISYCLERQIPIVSGTTGWLDQVEKMRALCYKEQGTLLYTSNFSIGVNIFLELTNTIGKLMKNYPTYQPEITEIHHVHKKDAPSGTAITIAEHLLKHLDLTHWSLPPIEEEKTLPIISKRLPDVPGTHEISFASDIDTISLKHTAHNRDGFATGAIMAAKFIKDKKGVFGMKDLLGF